MFKEIISMLTTQDNIFMLQLICVVSFAVKKICRRPQIILQQPTEIDYPLNNLDAHF